VQNVFYSSYRKNERGIIYFLSDLCQKLLIIPNNMDTKRNQTLEEIEENKIVNEHYQNRVMLIKKLLKTSRLATVDLCVHIDISEASYYRYINFTSYMKADIFIHACLFLKQYIESHHIPYTQEEKRLIKTLDLFQISSNSNLNCN
jgi:hypothetical protein